MPCVISRKQCSYHSLDERSQMFWLFRKACDEALDLLLSFFLRWGNDLRTFVLIRLMGVHGGSNLGAVVFTNGGVSSNVVFRTISKLANPITSLRARLRALDINDGFRRISEWCFLVSEVNSLTKSSFNNAKT